MNSMTGNNISSMRREKRKMNIMRRVYALVCATSTIAILYALLRMMWEQPKLAVVMLAGVSVLALARCDIWIGYKSAKSETGSGRA